MRHMSSGSVALLVCLVVALIVILAPSDARPLGARTPEISLSEESARPTVPGNGATPESPVP
jgi:hypothetical protein